MRAYYDRDDEKDLQPTEIQAERTARAHCPALVPLVQFKAKKKESATRAAEGAL
jgi:hypothetical protein